MPSNLRTLTTSARHRASCLLRRARVNAGLTQEQAAERVGICLRHYADMERGDVPMRALEAFVELETLAAKRAA